MIELIEQPVTTVNDQGQRQAAKADGEPDDYDIQRINSGIDGGHHAALARDSRVDRLPELVIDRDLKQIAQLFLLVEGQAIVADDHRVKFTDDLVNQLDKLVGVFNTTLGDIDAQCLALLELQLPDPVQRFLYRHLFLAHERLIGVTTENHFISELLEQAIGRARQFFVLDK